MPTTKVLLDGARIAYAPLGTTLVLDSVPLGGTLPVAWKEVGYTSEPVKLTAKFDVYKVMVQQKKTYIAKKKTTSDVNFSTALTDFSADNMALALGGIKSTIAAGANQPPVEVFTYADDSFIPQNLWMIEGGYIDTVANANYPCRIFIFSGSPSEGTDTAVDQAKESLLNLTIEAGSTASGIFHARWITGVATP